MNENYLLGRQVTIVGRDDLFCIEDICREGDSLALKRVQDGEIFEFDCIDDALQDLILQGADEINDYTQGGEIHHFSELDYGDFFICEGNLCVIIPECMEEEKLNEFEKAMFKRNAFNFSLHKLHCFEDDDLVLPVAAEDVGEY